MTTDHIKFVGTGSAAASKERFHSSFVFYSGGKYCLIDAGDGVSKALLNAGIPFNEISSIIISHMHPDHYSGLAGLLIQMKLNKRTEELSLYVHESLQDTILNFINTSYLFIKRLGFPFRLNGFTQYEFFHPSENLEVLARQNSHLDGYIKDSPGELSYSCSSFLFNFHNKPVFYTGDIGAEEDLYIFDDYNLDIMISEVSHISLPAVLKSFRASGAAKLYLTHLSDGDEQQILNSLTKEMSGKVIIAKEDLAVSF